VKDMTHLKQESHFMATND